MVKKWLNLGLQLAITAVLKLGNVFAIFIFPDYRKAPDPPTNAPSAPTTMNDTNGTDTLTRPNHPEDNTYP